ncbi:ATP-binding protein [Desulfopila sp. IMCC35008]|uniref:sensor histidine kinase n=1 Tax=Desulfopila sp. IMCC35008 TaxID=2653858 RepID=UPI00197A98A7|nr:ATP-binding protein [Desulfopila sp. IMCC35008]
MVRKRRNKRIIIATLFFVILGFVTIWVTSIVMYNRGLNRLSEDGVIRLELFVTYLQGILRQYESLPELLATDEQLVSALLNPSEDKRIDKLNRYLETINYISDTADTYLMDKEGLTIAASNWNEDHPFVGRNFSFRPYFVEAMKGQLGRYFALGTTSAKRGYYFAYPVRKEGEILGVVVIKINIDSVEQAWAGKGESFLVTDPDGVVFITTNNDWRFHTLTPMREEARRRIVDSRRYPNAGLEQLTSVEREFNEGKKLVHLALSGKRFKNTSLLLSRDMPEAGWNVHILMEVDSVRKTVFWVNLMVGTLLLLGFVLVLLLLQRQLRMAELSRIRQEAQKALEEANEQLENRVQERTRELTATNRLLRREIQDRQRTEEDLRKTRNELIHAAKMAVLGQMSAGINHELNQPLAAIRSYTDNGMQFLDRGRLEETMYNLEQIGELTERMAQIGVQLKLFSRKAKGQIRVVALHGVLDGALEILKPTIRKAEVDVSIELNPDDVEVKANHVMLQQVFVNLIGNGIQAMEGCPKLQIAIRAEARKDKVIILVQDSGPGINNNDRESIFDPFFTTKKSGQGLGLGLTISDRILREMRGSIQYIENDTQGACFEVTLEKA